MGARLSTNCRSKWRQVGRREATGWHGGEASQIRNRPRDDANGRDGTNGIGFLSRLGYTLQPQVQAPTATAESYLGYPFASPFSSSGLDNAGSPVENTPARTAIFPKRTKMRLLLSQIQAALSFNLYYVSLYAALAVPDICGAIDADDGLATRASYSAWFDRFVAPKYVILGRPSLTGQDCYYFRCSLLHQGSAQNPKSRFSRIIFVEPTVGNVVMHNNIMDDALNIDVRLFCCDIVDGALLWLDKVEGTEKFERNSAKYMRRHPDGLPPYVVGLPVIA